MDRTENSNELNEDIKLAAVELMANAWADFDNAAEEKERGRYARIHEKIFRSLEYGIKSFCVLHNQSVDAEGKIELLGQMIASRHVCFRTCHKNFFSHYNYWKDHPSEIIYKKRLAAGFKRFYKEVEKVLKSIETYNFYLRRSVYSTKQEIADLKRKKKRLVSAICAFFAFVLFGLYPLYLVLDPVLLYKTSGQFFWTSASSPAENELNSVVFSVEGDGEYHEYIVSTPRPIDVIDLRLDPVREKKVRVWIDAIELSMKDQPAVIFNFKNDKNGWISANHIDQIKILSGTLFFETTGNDPYLRKHQLNTRDLISIKIRMKISLRKTFLQWIFS